MRFSAVIVAAGVGARAGPGEAKQWRRLAGRAVARWSADALLAAGADELVVVIGEGQQDLAQSAFEGLPGLRLVLGGAARSDSVAQITARRCAARDIGRASPSFLSITIERVAICRASCRRCVRAAGNSGLLPRRYGSSNNPSRSFRISIRRTD